LGIDWLEYAVFEDFITSPVNLKAVLIDNDHVVHISWDKVKESVSYEVLWSSKETPDNWNVITNLQAEYYDHALNSSYDTYNYKVIAINKNGIKSYESSVVSITYENSPAGQDNIAPVIVLNGTANMDVTLGSAFSDPEATATDNVDGDITANIVVGGDTVDTNTLGTYIITYNVSDSSGNAATEVTRTVNVIALVTADMLPLNDTGITWGGNYTSGNNGDCTGEIIGEQDCSHGRDYLAEQGQLNKVGAGEAGFDFTKLDANGNTLPANAASWSCVKDNHTGLIWEVKTDTAQGTDLHSKEDRYNWYNPDSTTNGGTDGYADDDGNICTGYNSGDSSTFCNTQAFVARVNAAGLCGATDWRLPNLNELQSIANLGKTYPAIDTAYFPQTQSSFYWSSSPYADSRYTAWGVNFNFGYDYDGYRSNDYHVRLVRSGQ